MKKLLFIQIRLAALSLVLIGLAMLGGFLAPVIVSKGENLPVPLFGYLLVLSCGAMLCAFWRKWRAINLLALAGTFLLYTGWFEKFFLYLCKRLLIATDGRFFLRGSRLLHWLLRRSRISNS